MGFGFSLLLMFVILPATGLLGILWLITRQSVVGSALALIWCGVVSLIIVAGIAGWLTSDKVLDREDYNGSYVIDRDFFPGKDADWQYNHFGFEIRKNDSIYFHRTEGERIVKTWKGTVKTTTTYRSARLIVEMDTPAHHIVAFNPTTFRSAWGFYLVFSSRVYRNMFFRKGRWKPLTEQ